MQSHTPPATTAGATPNPSPITPHPENNHTTPRTMTTLVAAVARMGALSIGADSFDYIAHDELLVRQENEKRVGGGVRIHPENACMSGRHGVQYVAHRVACAALTLVVWQ